MSARPLNPEASIQTERVSPCPVLGRFTQECACALMTIYCAY